jgi:aspartyl-tRNA(Asn)/glutamyl-tRNA(Gln) amidotransferase subunit A
MNQDRRDFLQDSARLGAFALTSAAAWRIEPTLAQSVQGSALATMTIVELAQLLANQKMTSRQLVEQALVAINDPKGEGSRTFLSVHETEALAAADRVDAQRREGVKLPTLAGIPISIKDLFDEAGVTTLSIGRHSSGDTRLDRRRAIKKSRSGRHRSYQLGRVRLFGPRHQPALWHTEKRL